MKYYTDVLLEIEQNIKQIELLSKNVQNNERLIHQYQNKNIQYNELINKIIVEDNTNMINLLAVIKESLENQKDILFTKYLADDGKILLTFKILSDFYDVYIKDGKFHCDIDNQNINDIINYINNQIMGISFDNYANVINNPE